MSSSVAERFQKKSPNMRSIALPAEHGGWSLILEPLVLGLLLAFSWSGLVFALSSFLAFLTHQPAKIYVKDKIKGRSTRRTQLALYFVLAYGLLSLVLAIPILVTAPSILWLIIGMILPLILIQLAFDFQNKSRDLIPELCGAIALSGTVALITILGNLSLDISLLLWGLISLRAVVSIFFVRTLFRKQRGKPASIKFTYSLHMLALALSISLTLMQLTSFLIIVPFVILLGHAWKSIESPTPLKPKTVGFREVAFGVITILCFAIGFSIG